MNKTILIIEDELKIRFLIRDYLKSEGFNVLEASDGDEGIFVFKNKVMAAKKVDVNNVMSGGIFIYNINIVIIKKISIGMIVLYILFISFFIMYL